MVFSITSRSGDGASPVSARRFRLSLPALLVLSGAEIVSTTRRCCCARCTRCGTSIREWRC
uniref:Uncharacterized protein n=1 Tax=Salmonella sp. 14 TaxID=1179812 RepID=I3W310_9ENTR|nr:hypothetical protein [Salmonella sp. 14]